MFANDIAFAPRICYTSFINNLEATVAKFDEAKVLFGTLCQTLDNMQWKYNKEEREDNFALFTSAVGKDLTMKLAIRIDVDRQVMYLKSPMPFAVPQEMRDTLAKALIIANWSMLNGSFEMDMNDGFVAFKMIVPYMSSMLSTEVCRYMIVLSCNMVDKFNDKLDAICKGQMTLTEFQNFVNQN